MKYFWNICWVFCVLYSCKTPEARRPISSKTGSFINESVIRNKKLSTQEEAVIKQIIARDTSNTYHSSTSGFWYYYKEQDSVSTIVPEFGDIVNFDYEIKDLQYNTIYTKEELKNTTYAIDKGELFYGLREGLKLMKAGEIVTFLFPSFQAYGYYGDTDKIGTNIPLIVNVKLHTIKKNSSKL